MQIDESYADVRVVGGENMADERPLTEGLELFDTGVEVGLKFSGTTLIIADITLTAWT